MLETHVKLGVTELDFPEKKFSPKNLENGPKTEFFEKKLSLIFTEFVL